MGRVKVKAAVGDVGDVGDVGWYGFYPWISSPSKGRTEDLCSSGDNAVEWNQSEKV